MNDNDERKQRVKETIKMLLVDVAVVVIVAAVIVGIGLLPIWGHSSDNAGGSTLIMTHLLRRISGRSGFGF